MTQSTFESTFLKGGAKSQPFVLLYFFKYDLKNGLIVLFHFFKSGFGSTFLKGGFKGGIKGG
jgi:hypothetical protein